jgi:hypothetical protein
LPWKGSIHAGILQEGWTTVLALQIALFIAVTAVLAYFLWPRPAFVIRIEEGEARLRRGKAPSMFVEACGDVAAREGIRQGEIRGIRSGRKARLRFSRDIPARAHQALRNVWSLCR